MKTETDKAVVTPEQAAVIAAATLAGDARSEHRSINMTAYYGLVVAALIMIGFSVWATMEGALMGRGVNLGGGLFVFAGALVLLGLAAYFRSKAGR